MEAITWDPIVATLENPHVLQTWEWGEFKARNQWRPNPVLWFGNEELITFHSNPGSNIGAETQSPLGAALVLERKITVPRRLGVKFKVLYVPKGPVLHNWADERLRTRVLDDLKTIAEKKRAIFIKIDPDVLEGTGKPRDDDQNLDPTGLAVLEDLRRQGWYFSAEQVQFRNTVLIDLKGSEDELLRQMKQKTRYNVRLAGRKGVTVRLGGLDDLRKVYQMYAETSVRDGFVIRDQDYYLDAWGRFLQAKMADLLIAEVDEQPVAALFLYYFANRAWYLFGMSTKKHREKMPSYLLQWEAIKRAKSRGCIVYDLWGAPDVFDEGDPLWGVYRFKEGLGGEVVRYIGAWDLPVRPFYYRIYMEFMPRIFGLLRSRGRSVTRQSIAGPSI